MTVYFLFAHAHKVLNSKLLRAGIQIGVGLLPRLVHPVSLRIAELCVYSSKRPGKQLVVRSGQKQIHLPQRELRNCVQNETRDLAVCVCR